MEKERKSLLMDALGLGLLLWAMGFGLSMVLFMLVPVGMIGWFIFPVLLPVTVFVAYRRLKGKRDFTYCRKVAFSWLIIAVMLDFILIVRLFGVQGYYDTDVLLYYVLTFTIPLLAGLKYEREKAK